MIASIARVLSPLISLGFSWAAVVTDERCASCPGGQCSYCCNKAIRGARSSPDNRVRSLLEHLFYVKAWAGCLDIVSGVWMKVDLQVNPASWKFHNQIGNQTGLIDSHHVKLGQQINSKDINEVHYDFQK